MPLFLVFNALQSPQPAPRTLLETCAGTSNSSDEHKCVLTVEDGQNLILDLLAGSGYWWLDVAWYYTTLWICFP
jgi:hypothetical protein